MPEPTPPQTPADAGDDFEITSASNMMATASPAADTTTEPNKRNYLPESPPAEPEEDEDAEPVEAADTSEKPGAVAKTAEPARETAKPPVATAGAKPKKKGPSVDDRKKALTREIDDLTWRKHQTQREVDELIQRAASLRGSVPPQADQSRREPEKPAQPVAKPFPAPPRYQDFDTDAEYDKALGKWKDQDVPAWQQERDRDIETRITQGFEARLTRHQEEQAAEAAEASFVSQLNASRAAHPDWEEKRAALADLRSSWHDPTRHGPVTTPFLYDLAQSIEQGGELLYQLGADLDKAQILADLLPTRPLRDAIVASSSPLELLDHFATPEGLREFEQLKAMHPVRLFQAIGALTARLAAPRGPAPVSHPITQAVPSAKPPVGTPRARESGGTSKPQSYEEWMREEDAKERRDRERLAGIAR